MIVSVKMASWKKGDLGTPGVSGPKGDTGPRGDSGDRGRRGLIGTYA